MKRQKPLNWTLWIPLVFSVMSCGGGHQFRIPDRPPNDMRPVPKPAAQRVNLIQDNLEKSLLMPSTRFFDLARQGRKIVGKPRQAFDIDAFGDVYNSSWFTNRNARERLSLAEIASGPCVGSGPDTSEGWRIFTAKVEQGLPEFSIVDRHGSRYELKFDPAGYAEMATGAELVTSKLFYAAGYNVPENYLVIFNLKKISVEPDIAFTDANGLRHILTKDDLEALLTGVEKRPDGFVRAVASKYLPGVPLGPFKYIGLRKDDLNDVIPHEFRRELRGLKVMAAWLNFFDTKARNTADIYCDAGYVKHFLVYFNATLGSGIEKPLPPEVGKEGPTDPAQIGKLFGSLGIYKRPWEKPPDVKFTSVGNFSSRNFHPAHYKYILPNPAFGNATDLDEFWGTKLVMSFTEEQIRRAVAQGRYSDPAAAEYLVQTILQRQRIIGRTFWKDKNTLDQFKLEENVSGQQILSFEDLSVKYGLTSEEKNGYRFSLHQNGSLVLTHRALENGLRINLSELNIEFKTNNGDIYWKIDLQMYPKQTNKWSKPVRVFLGKSRNTAKIKLLGMKR